MSEARKQKGIGMGKGHDIRILVVEDDKDAARHFSRALGEVGWQVDTANTLKDALERVEGKTYHVALVDIMLAGEHNRTNRDGLVVLKRLKELQEGTKAIVLSGQDEPQLSADTLQEYGALQYLDKRKIQQGGIGVVTDRVQQALKDVSVMRYGWRKGRPSGEQISVLTFMSGGEDNEPVWTDQCLRALKPSAAYRGLKSFLDDFCAPLLPIFPERGSESAMRVDSDRSLVSGCFWSKALGLAVKLVIHGSPLTGDPSSVAVADDGRTGALIFHHEASGLRGECYEWAGASREDFEVALTLRG